MKAANDNVEHQVLDLDGDGHVSAGELGLAAAVVVGAVGLGFVVAALLVGLCGG